MTKARRITRIAISAVLLFLGAQFAIHASPSFTLQTLALFILSTILSPRDAVTSTLVYLFLGIVGVPVFSGFQSGIGVILNVGGGFLISFPFLAFFISFMTRKFAKGFIPRFTVFLLATLLSYVFAFIWLIIITNKAVSEILLYYVLAFLPFDIIKCAIAPIVIKKLEGVIRK